MAKQGAAMYALTRGQVSRAAFMAAGKLGLIPEARRYELGLVERPHYAYGLRNAAIEARRLGHRSVTAIEFGVAGGNGLLALERHAEVVENETGIAVHVVGFDSGQGLTAPTDYRDVPFLWAEGDFKMDEAALRTRLRRSDLVIGDVRESARDYVAQLDPGRPIGFVAFDLDLWSSTVGAFDVFRGPSTACLPRVWCYFDDVVAMVEDLGVLRAIREFNDEDHGRRIRHPWMLRANVPFQSSWADQIFQAHLFDHPEYCTMLAEPADRELPLDQAG